MQVETVELFQWSALSNLMVGTAHSLRGLIGLYTEWVYTSIWVYTRYEAVWASATARSQEHVVTCCRLRLWSLLGLLCGTSGAASVAEGHPHTGADSEHNSSEAVETEDVK